MTNTKPKLKKDQFRRTRGGYSRWLVLSCEKCKTRIMVYQKDGSGILKRLYLDRIFAPKFRVGKGELICRQCRNILGVPIMYKKESRPAYRLFAGAIEKKIIKTGTANL